MLIPSEKVGPGAEAPGSVSTAALPQDAYAARRASMTTLSLAFRVLVRCPEQGLPAPNRSSPYRKSHLILPKQGRTRDPFTVQSNLTSPPSETPWLQTTHRSLPRPLHYQGQDASGGGAGYRPRVLKRYYEPVINLTRIIPRSRPKVHRPLKVRESGDARSLRTGDDRRRARRSSKSLSNPSCNRTRDAGPPRAHPTQRGREPADRRAGPIPSAYGSHQPGLGAMGLRRLRLPQPREAVRQSG
ncbi:hypothetical protein WYO_5181 [Methylobacterium sp. GXF4]|nr:hypothetical protein WYO_5181 [Methylobacterium sp. GXF4]